MFGEDRRGKEMKETEVMHHCMFTWKEGSSTAGGDEEMQGAWGEGEDRACPLGADHTTQHQTKLFSCSCHVGSKPSRTQIAVVVCAALWGSGEGGGCIQADAHKTQLQRCYFFWNRHPLV